jgi:hypothetical protein
VHTYMLAQMQKSVNNRNQIETITERITFHISGHSNHEGVSNYRGAWNDVIIRIDYCKAENKYAQ